ncbi:CHAT domain-containing protein [Novipirellula maiorica]|uniref:CHAT domain-containing protein n=1 Tax=Novipirellula maiorica TaxID=1265734 RepID=UPI001360B0D7|nr:CHAT domain-containing protein [Rhodopirellula maiorica]
MSHFREEDFELGQTFLHLQDATVQITRALIGGGASISYGGGFKIGRATSMSPLLGELIEAYNETAINPAQRLRMFQSANAKLEDIPETVRCHLRHLGKSSDLADARIFNDEELAQLPFGMVYSEMRAVMTAETDARVAIGGQLFPKDADDSSGYGGRFPGIAEEVFRALEAKQPFYLCGGFGGLTRRLAGLMQFSDQVDGFWDERTYGGNRRFTALVWDFDHHPKRSRLQLPPTLLALATSIEKFAAKLGDDDDRWRNFNGLSRQQNEVLWNATDPILLSSLISEGLMRWRSRGIAREGKLRVEAIHGNVTSVTQADVLALPVFDDVDPQGAGAAIDRVTGGMVQQAQSQPGRLIGVRSDQLDVDYLCAVSLGKVSEKVSERDEKMIVVREAITNAAKQIMLTCRSEGFHSLAIVTFGGSTLNRYADAVKAMLKGFQSRPDGLVIKWVEADEDRFGQLLEELRGRKDIDVTTVLKPTQAEPPTSYPWFNLTIKYENGKLDITALPQHSTGTVWTNRVEVDAQTLDDLTAGVGVRNKQTPSAAELKQRGLTLTRLLFGTNVDDFWNHCQNCPIAITLDAAASKIPFEMMRFDNGKIADDAPAIRGGIHRWLAVGGGRMSNSFGRPRLSRKLRVGLVIDPTNNLDGARREGQAIKRTLKAMGSEIQWMSLGDEDQPATRDRVIDMLRQVDVLHYCGHAFFDENDPTQSGLLLAANERLTGQDLSAVTPIPRVIIFNACEAGRVRGESVSPQYESYSLAEMVLRSGVEAFIGTLWEVGDAAAADFAMGVYGGLTGGLTLRDAVTQSRKQLAENHQNDWANYILYGDGRFRLA